MGRSYPRVSFCQTHVGGTVYIVSADAGSYLGIVVLGRDAVTIDQRTAGIAGIGCGLGGTEVVHISLRDAAYPSAYAGIDEEAEAQSLP